MLLKLGLFSLLAAGFLSISQQAKADRVAFLGRPDRDMQARVDLIRNAKDDIYMQIYEIAGQEDLLAETQLALLIDRATEPDVPGKKHIEVYIVVDAMNSKLTDEQLLVLNSYKHLKVKLFSAFNILKPLKYNNRMHNKLLVADGSIAVVGGRNATINYFDLNCAHEKENFADVDILVMGNGNDPKSATTQFRDYAKVFFNENPGQVTEHGGLISKVDVEATAESSREIMDTKYCKSADLNQFHCKKNEGQRCREIEICETAQKKFTDAKIKFLTALNVFRAGLSNVAETSDNAHIIQALNRLRSCTDDRSFENIAYNSRANWSDSSQVTVAEVGEIHALFNNPRKPLEESDSNNIAHQLQSLIRNEFTQEKLEKVEQPTLEIISPYVSMVKGMRETIIAIQNEVKIYNEKHAQIAGYVPKSLNLVLITNSKISNDVGIAQACYEKYAKPEFMNLGATIFEYSGTLNDKVSEIIDANRENPEFIGKEVRIGHLHQKMVIVNKSKYFIGSFNQDMRSSNINLEIGAFFDTNPMDFDRLSVNQQREMMALRDRINNQVQLRLLAHSAKMVDHGQSLTGAKQVTDDIPEAQENKKAVDKILTHSIVCNQI